MSGRIDQLFARAENAFRHGRNDVARADLHALLPQTGEHPAVLHLLALVERQAGRTADADAAFRRALRAAPDDPQINNNYANLLDDLGDPAGALRHYDRAVARVDFIEARLNRALLLERLGRWQLAESDARRVIAAAPASPAGHTVLGSILRAQGRLDEAAAAFDAALAITPTRVRALHGRARVALERGEDTAVAHYCRALTASPEDGEVILGLASALEAEGDARAIETLAEALTKRPGWVEGHREMIRMRSEAGMRDNAMETLDAALAKRPDDTTLHRLRWQTLVQLGRHDDARQALDDAVRQGVPQSAELRLVEAVCVDEAGDAAAAARLFATLDRSLSEVAIAYGRHLLRTGHAERAATVLEGAIVGAPGDVAVWAHLDLAWRLTGDERHRWLSGRPELIRTASIGFDDNALAELTDILRALHRSRAHPIGQSLRGGTQTRGALLQRGEPVLRRLRVALESSVTAYVDALPPLDAAHPLLRHRRGRPTIAGSWSVRLTASGFHVSHIHPEGVLSSACHIGLPPDDSVDHQAGWLELGAPPPELRLDCGPLASIKPRAGWLTLFPSYLFHGTRPFADGERLTVAFDVALT